MYFIFTFYGHKENVTFSLFNMIFDVCESIHHHFSKGMLSI